MAIEDFLYGLPQVLQEVKAVGHLHGVGRATGRSLGIGPAPIPADHLDPRMVLQPGRQRRRGPIR
jgi:hypothetical protein